MRKNKHAAKRMTALAMAGLMVTCQGVSMVQAAERNSLKEEVVYANLDSTGGVTGVYVVNSFAGGDIVDYGTYSSVKNLTTTDEITVKNDTITFHTEAGKVYYQGELEKAEIPWNIEIHYFIDGKEYQADEIAGMSGALEIKISITQNEKCEESFWQGYALQATLTLDTAICKNIVAEDATIANVGSDKQISYIIMPGKGAELSITADVNDFEMDEMSINGTKLSLSFDMEEDKITDKVQELKDAVSDLDEGADKLNEGADELADGALALYDGSLELNDGVKELKEGTGKLGEGVKTLDEGAGELRTGSEAIKEGAGELKTGAESLNSGASDLNNGAKELNTGAKSANEGAKSVNEGAESLKKGIAQMQKALKELNKQSGNLTGGSKKVLTALQTIQKSLSEVSVTTEDLGKLVENSGQIKTGINGIYNGLVAMDSSIDTYYASLSAAGIGDMNSYLAQHDQAIAALNINVTGTQRAVYEAFMSGDGNNTTAAAAKIQELAAQGDTEAVQILQKYQEIVAAGGDGDAVFAEYISDAVTAVSMESVKKLLEGDKAYIAGSSQLISGIDSSLNSETGELMTGAAILNQKYAEFDTAISGMVEKLSGLADNMTTLKAGIDTLVKEYGILDSGIKEYTGAVTQIVEAYDEIYNGSVSLAKGTKELYEGTKELYEGAKTLQNGTKELVGGTSDFVKGTKELENGTSDLLKGISELKDGTGEFVNGVSELKDGAEKLSDGTSEFVDGTSELKDGTIELKDGTTELKDGTVEFSDETVDMDNEISDTIDETIEELTGKNIETVSFVSEKNVNIDSVLFVMKVPAIEIEEVEDELVEEEEPKGFWEKLLDLFR